MAHFAPLNLGLGPLIETGAHAASVLAVALGLVVLLQLAGV